MAQLHSGVYVCIEGAADEVPAGEVAVRANGRFSSPFRDRRFRLRVLADVARSAVRYLVRTAVDNSKDADGMAGDDLGRSERTGTGAQGRRIGVFATGAIRSYRVPAAGIGHGHVGGRSTVEARGGGGSGIVRVLQPPLAAEPTDAERIAFPTKTLSGIIAGGRGKVPRLAGIRAGPDGGGESRRANRAGERASRRDIWISARRFVGTADGHLGSQEASGRVFGISNQVSESATKISHGSDLGDPWIAQGRQRVPRGDQVEPAGNRRGPVGVCSDPGSDGAAETGTTVPASAKNGVDRHASGRNRARFQQPVDGNSELRQFSDRRASEEFETSARGRTGLLGGGTRGGTDQPDAGFQQKTGVSVARRESQRHRQEPTEDVARIIGEHIEIKMTLAEDLVRVRADAGQLEQVLMNLSVNARDAMPQGGRLALETRNVELDEDFVRAHIGSGAGPHTLLAVSDTGMGMDAATQARIF